MEPELVEAESVSLVGYTDLEDKPAFKIAMQNVDDRWYIYLSHFWHSGWSIVDVTDPTSPELVRFVKGPQNTQTLQVQVSGGKMVTSLEKPRENWGPVEGELYQPNQPYETGVYIWDVAENPTGPSFLGHYETGGRGTHRNFYDGGDYVFLCASPEGYEPEGWTNPATNYFLEIIDISNPEEPTKISEWMWPGQHPDDEAERVARYFHGPAYVDGEKAYLSYGRVGAVTLDISDIEQPELLWRLNFGEGLGSGLGVHSVVPIPDTDLLAINSEGILEAEPMSEHGYPMDYTYLVYVDSHEDPGYDGRTHSGPRVVGALPLPKPERGLPYDSYYEKDGVFGPHNQHHPRGEACRFHSDELLIMTFFNAGLRVFDISDPQTPTEIGYAVPESPPKRIGTIRPRESLATSFEDVAVDSRGYIYATDANRGLFVFESELIDNHK